MVTSLYDDLGIAADADGAAIKAAHRRKARDHHPDKPGGDADAFNRVQRAYMVLRDPDKRARYDETGNADEIRSQPGRYIELMVQAFDAAMGQIGGRFDVHDVIKVARSHLEQLRSTVKNNRRQTIEAQKQINKILKRLKFKGDGPDVIGNTMRSRLGEINIRLAACDVEIEHLEKATEHMGDYVLTPDAMPTMTATTGSWTVI